MKNLHFSRLNHVVHYIISILGPFLRAPAFTFKDFMTSSVTVICEPIVDVVLEKVFPMYKAMSGFRVGGARAAKGVNRNLK